MDKNCIGIINSTYMSNKVSGDLMTGIKKHFPVKSVELKHVAIKGILVNVFPLYGDSVKDLEFPIGSFIRGYLHNIDDSIEYTVYRISE